MIADVDTEAQRTGLELHPDKTKILHNQPNRRRPPHQAKVNNMTIQIMTYNESQKYLGRKITFHQPTQTEIENRIAAGWRKFYLFKSELTTRSYSLKGRLRLFDGTITPTVLYGCASWTMTTELTNRLKRTQRQMLRMILNSPRRRNETSATTTHNNTITPNNNNNNNNNFYGA